jgi:hypothetical protein
MIQSNWLKIVWFNLFLPLPYLTLLIDCADGMVNRRQQHTNSYGEKYLSKIFRRNSDVVQKLVVQLSCNSKMTHSRVHVGM